MESLCRRRSCARTQSARTTSCCSHAATSSCSESTGFVALTVPEEYGGLGENHVAFAMTCETIARYGCASTAMCYVMHMGAVAALMLRPTPEILDKYIRPLNTGYIGTLSYSDPETGSHFLVPG